MNNKQNNIIAINNFIGYGKLNAKFNFFAIEENAGDENKMTPEEKKDDKLLQEIIISLYSDRPYTIITEQLINAMGPDKRGWLDRINKNAEKNNLYTCVTAIYNYFNPDKKIKNIDIGYSNIDLLFGNFFPIGKINTSTIEYSQLIRNLYPVKDFNEYNKYYKSEREKIFTQFLCGHILNSNYEKYLFTFGYKQIDYYNYLNRILDNHLKKQGKEKITDYKFSLMARNQDRYFYIKINNTHIYSFFHTGNGWLNINQINKLIDRKFINIE